MKRTDIGAISAICPRLQVDEEADTLGWYEVTAADGRTVRLPAVYGKHLSGADCYFERRPHAVYDCYETDRRLKELTGTAVPCSSGDGVWFETVYAVPFPAAEIAGWCWIPREGAFTWVETRSWEAVEGGGRMRSGQKWSCYAALPAGLGR